MNKIYSLLGLCMKSGNLVSGDDSTLLDIKRNRVHLVLIAEDASENTKKLFKDKCLYRNISYYYFSTKYDLGEAIGKAPRAVIGIRDINFSNKIKELLKNN